jgi:hypothetical protein
MMNTRSNVAGLLMTTVIVAAWGCGSGTVREDTTTEEATVSGTVKFKGQLLDKGEVIFNAGNSSRAAPSHKANIGKDGSYTVKTLVGENTVEVNSPIILKAGPNMPPFTKRVTSGENKIDIELPMDPAHP